MKRSSWIALALLLLISLVVELMVVEGHGHWWNAIPGFYALYGLAGCVAIIVVSKWLGKILLQKREDYYD